MANNDDAPRGPIGRIWRWFRNPWVSIAGGTVVVLGFVGGIVFWGGFHTAMEMTNKEEFCVSCHEMAENVFVEYEQTVHYTNRTGVRATCPDCHVPKEWQHKIVRKIQASNEVYHHLLGSISTPEKFNEKRLELASHVWKAMKTTDSRECRNCHAFDYMDLSRQENRAARLHEKALTAGATCIDCHRGIAHSLPAGAEEAAAKLYEELGYPYPPFPDTLAVN